MKLLTTDINVIIEALDESKVVEIDEKNFKIKRVLALPDKDRSDSKLYMLESIYYTFIHINTL